MEERDFVEFKEFVDGLKKWGKKIDEEGVYFRDVVKATTGYEIIRVGENFTPIISQVKSHLANNLGRISDHVEEKYVGRSNELGNFFEGVLSSDLNSISGFRVHRPGLGYPDLILSAKGVDIYIECKIYQMKTLTSTLRSFYFKASDKSGINRSCPHILIGFEAESRGGENKSPFIVKDLKIVDLYDLKVYLKPEFNNNNPGIYHDCRNL